MTANDNIRHYIGDLETTEDIDVVFKHIYDLMLANGGEGSGLNADMVDGYHASDFAPASLKDEIDNCIHAIIIGGERYTGAEVTLMLWAYDVFFNRTSTNQIEQVDTFLNDIDSRVFSAENDINGMKDIADFFSNESIRNALTNIINHNVNIIKGSDGGEQYYLDADSVNGLSFEIITQERYDLLPNEKKLNPRNIYIINNDIDECFNQGKYAPPSILQAGMNLEFRINTSTYNIEFSTDGRPRYVYVDNRKTTNPEKEWHVLLPLVGDGTTEDGKGILYPDWFDLIQNVMTDENLLVQDNYPFLLNTEATKEALVAGLGEGKINGVTIGDTTVEPTDSDTPYADITDILNSYLTNWASSNIPDTSQIEDNIATISNNLSQYELLSNKIRDSIVGDGMADEYPSTLAVVNYVKPKIEGIQDSINRVISNTVKSITNTSTDSQYPTAKAVYSFVTSKIPAIATSIGSSSKDNQAVSPLAVYKYVTSYVTSWAKGSSVSFKKTGSGLTNLKVTCTEYKWGYKIYVTCDKWAPTKAYQKMQVGTFGKSICSHYIHGLSAGYMDIKIQGAKLFFHSSSGTTHAKSEIYTYILIPK